MKWTIFLLTLVSLVSCTEIKTKKDSHITPVTFIEEAPTLDGRPIENFWNLLEWHPIDQNWIGGPFDHDDFNGKFKIAWNRDGLYLLLEIVDDSLYKKSKDPLKLWWNDDCVIVYIDEDNSGGLHQYNHNAFTYHVALDGNVADLGNDKNPKLYNDHIKSVHETEDKTTYWEMFIKVYPDTYIDDSDIKPVALTKKKKIGFALAYADNDTSTERENLIGSVFISGENKNNGWIDASVFGTLELVE
tara:strand:+ start:5185 stop:5919 length:735 start_codon:yes stop_codon:yes gene_type:complete